MVFCQSLEMPDVLSQHLGRNTMCLEGFDSKADYTLTLFGNAVMVFHPNVQQQRRRLSPGATFDFPLSFFRCYVYFLLIGSPFHGCEFNVCML